MNNKTFHNTILHAPLKTTFQSPIDYCVYKPASNQIMHHFEIRMNIQGTHPNTKNIIISKRLKS